MEPHTSYSADWSQGDSPYDNKYYSVEETYKGKDVVILGSSQQVSIYYEGKLLEVHSRVTDPNQSKSTKPQHLKPWERAMQDDSFYRKRAQALGPHVDEMILKLLACGQGFIDTRKVWGILSLDKSYRADQIDAACGKALELSTLGFRAVKGFLEQGAALEWRRLQREANGGEVTAAPAPRTYKHVRPLSVYQEQLNLFTEKGSA